MPYYISIPLSGATIPDDVLEIDLEVDVAGRTFTSTFPPSANQTTTFHWDGMDAFGRVLPGSQVAKVSVGYVYQGIYQKPSAGSGGGGGIYIDPGQYHFAHCSYY